jgi:hypothetical protein
MLLIRIFICIFAILEVRAGGYFFDLLAILGVDPATSSDINLPVK